MNHTITAYETSLPAGSRTGGTFRFERVAYDAASDILHIERGPTCAVTREQSAEGDWLETSAPDGRLVALRLADARDRMRSGDLQVTIGPSQAIVIEHADLRGAVLGGGRFVRPVADPRPAARAHPQA